MKKGIIFDIKRYALHDGPGIRTTVFFKGCAATCWWCHNPESQDLKIEKALRINRFDQNIFEEDEIIGKTMTVAEVIKEISRDQVFYDESGGGVTVSGGEPLMQPDFLQDLLIQCKNSGFSTTLDTTGYAPAKIFAPISDVVDLFLYDIKFIDDKLHLKYTGVSNKNILTNLNMIIKNNKDVILRFPIIPGITDQKKNIDEILQYILNLNHGGLQIDLLPYHKIARHKYDKLSKQYLMGDTDLPTEDHMLAIKTKIESVGLIATIGG
jgi:pyruvate formate lyase activating enzyme